jgi:hypothetical protein
MPTSHMFSALQYLRLLPYTRKIVFIEPEAHQKVIVTGAGKWMLSSIATLTSCNYNRILP